MELRLKLITFQFLFLPCFAFGQTDSIPAAKGNLIWQQSDSARLRPQIDFSHKKIWVLLDGKLIESEHRRDSLLKLHSQHPYYIIHIDTVSQAKSRMILGPNRTGTVVALTTAKTSHKIRPWLQYRGEINLNWVGRRPEMLSPDQWVTLANEANINDGLALPYPQGINPNPIDWQKEVIRPSIGQSHQFALFGSGKFWQERYLSISALNQASPVASGQYDRYQSRLKLSRHRQNGHYWGINLNGTISQQKAYLPLIGPRESILFHTLLAPPTDHLEPSQLLFPSQNSSTAIYQPNLYADLRQQNLDQQIFNGKLFYDIVHETNWKVNSSINFQHWASRQVFQLPEIGTNNLLTRIDNSQLQSLQHRLYLAYDDDSFLDHRLSFSQNFRQEYYFWQWSSEPNTGVNRSQWRSYHSTFGFKYEHEKWPEVSGAIEWAMSDRMQPSKQMAFFPSLSLKWELPIYWGYANPRIDMSWGINGNDGSTLITQLSNLQLQQPFFPADNQLLNRNPDWERQNNLTFGGSVYLYHQLLFKLAYYYNRTDNLWVALTDEDQYLIWDNLAGVRNQGIESSLSFFDSNIFRSDLDLKARLNYQFNQNSLLELGDNAIHTIPNSGQLGALKEGEPLGSIWGYKTQGLYQEGDDFSLEPGKQAGDIRLVDNNGDGLIDETDQTIIARTLPLHSFNGNFEIFYKAFSLEIDLYGQGGHQIVNYQRLYGRDQINGNTHLFAEALNRWTPENTQTDIPRATYQSENRITDRLVESGNFLRLKQLKLNWDLITQKPSRRDHPFYEIDLYISGQNLFLLSKYSGYDPEVYLNGAPYYLGVDRGAYPIPRSLSLGVALQW